MTFEQKVVRTWSEGLDPTKLTIAKLSVNFFREMSLGRRKAGVVVGEIQTICVGDNDRIGAFVSVGPFSMDAEDSAGDARTGAQLRRRSLGAV